MALMPKLCTYRQWEENIHVRYAVKSSRINEVITVLKLCIVKLTLIFFQATNHKFFSICET